MARSRRQWVSQDDGSLHIISRVAGGELLFKEVDKEYFRALLEQLAAAFFVEIHAFVAMSNHFHIMATGLEREALGASKEELLRRYRLIYGKDANPPVGTIDSCGQLIPDEDEGVERLRRRLGSISRFVQELKQNFSRWYNKRNNRTGYLWGERFKGIITSKGEAQLAVSTYIDLNPVRANIVKTPEDYRWCSLGLRVSDRDRSQEFLCPLSLLPISPGLYEKDGKVDYDSEPSLGPLVLRKNSFDHFSTYREFIYRIGGIRNKKRSYICPEVLKEVEAYYRNFCVANLFSNRIKNFSQGIALGNYELIANLQKNLNRKIIRPRSFLGKNNKSNWSYTTRVYRS